CGSYGSFAAQRAWPDVESGAVPSAPKWTNTLSPATIGVGDARLFFGLMGPASLIWKTSTLTTSLPVSTSKASALSDAFTRSRFSFVSTTVVSQTFPPATTGEDHPEPETGVFQRMLRDSLHSSGNPRSVAWPWPVGPRN